MECVIFTVLGCMTHFKSRRFRIWRCFRVPVDTKSNLQWWVLSALISRRWIKETMLGSPGGPNNDTTLPFFYYFNRFHPHEQLLVEQLARPCSEPSFSTQANISNFTNTTNHHVHSKVYQLTSDDLQFHPILNLDRQHTPSNTTSYHSQHWIWSTTTTSKSMIECSKFFLLQIEAFSLSYSVQQSTHFGPILSRARLTKRLLKVLQNR